MCALCYNFCSVWQEAESGVGVPMVEVALCPADSLNMVQQCRRKLLAVATEEEQALLTPWHGASMAFSYFDSINSEQLWQRHSPTTGDDSLDGAEDY